MEKILNTYMFKGIGFFYNEYDWGTFDLKQNYLGKGILTSGVNANEKKKVDFWDDEIVALGLDFKLNNNFKLLLKQRGTYYASDISSQATSKIEQSRSTGGLKYNITNDIFFESSGGYEINSQRNDIGKGPVYEFGANANNIKFENFFFNGNMLGEYVSLNDGRRKSIFDVKYGVEQRFDEYDNLRFDIRYKTFLYPVSFSDVEKGSIKNRFEENITGNLNLNFSITENLLAGIGLAADMRDVSHYYNKFYSVSKRTGIESTRNDLRLNFSGQLIYKNDYFLQSIGVNFLRSDEQNTAKNKFGINENDLINLRNEEKLLDNIFEITQLRFHSEYLLTKNDTLKGNVFLSLFRYDTPSEQINDDRDELTESINLRYSRKISDILTAGFETELNMVHFVYIKSERSADNNWNRSLKFSPFVSINSQFLTINPLIYVVANYYAYDYEDRTGGVNSYSIREVGYKDSITVRFSNLINLSMKLKLRYYEQGYLFWKEFAETPQYSNSENFFETLLYYLIDDKFSMGSGFRFFELKQKNLLSYAFNTVSFEHYSYAPEFIIFYKTQTGIDFEMRGWYEYQKSKRAGSFEEVPNLILITKINI
jgi:hypothetical protein